MNYAYCAKCVLIGRDVEQLGVHCEHMYRAILEESKMMADQSETSYTTYAEDMCDQYKKKLGILLAAAKLSYARRSSRDRSITCYIVVCLESRFPTMGVGCSRLLHIQTRSIAVCSQSTPDECVIQCNCCTLKLQETCSKRSVKTMIIKQCMYLW